MKKLFQKILSLIISVFMSLGIFSCDLFVYNCNDSTFVDKYSNNTSNIYSSFSDDRVISEMLAKRNKLPHDFLAGYYTNNDTEITVTGLRAISYDIHGTYNYIYDYKEEILRIPDEINDIPITRIGDLAFEELEGHYYDNTGFPFIKTIIVGNNVKVIEENTLFDIRNAVIGKNVETCSWALNPSDFQTLYCYKNSNAYKEFTKYLYHESIEVILIDESHLTSNIANIDESGNVKGLPSGLTKENVTDYLSVDGDAIMEISDDVIGTGTVIELINSEYGTVDNTYTVIMDGDINGDGNVNTTDDITAVRNIISGNDSAFSEAHKKAADLNGDGLINSTDLVLMKSMQN